MNVKSGVLVIDCKCLSEREKSAIFEPYFFPSQRFHSARLDMAHVNGDCLVAQLPTSRSPNVLTERQACHQPDDYRTPDPCLDLLHRSNQNKPVEHFDPNKVAMAYS